MATERKKRKAIKAYDEDGMIIVGTAEPNNIQKLHMQLKKLSEIVMGDIINHFADEMKIKEKSKTQLKKFLQNRESHNLIYDIYCKNIAVRASEVGKDINNILNEEVNSCKRTLEIYNRIIDCDVFNPEKNRRLKGKKINPVYLYLIAEEI